MVRRARVRRQEGEIALRTNHYPDFFVVGAPKCGTTALHSYLGQHPRIFMPSQKEVHHFGSDLAGLPATLSPYQHRRLFDDASEASIVGETCIWALYSKNAAREIKAACPDAKIVILLRDPIDLAHALHSEYLYQGIEDISRFDRALRAEPDRQRGRRLPCRDLYPASIYLYRQIVSFSDQVERYFAEFRPERIHIILFEEFKRNLSSAYQNLLAFLDVDPVFSPSFPLINANKRLRSARLQHWLRNPRKTVPRLARRVFPFPNARRRAAEAAARWNVVQAPRPPLSSALRAWLSQELAPDIQRLGQRLGRDLASVWTVK